MQISKHTEDGNTVTTEQNMDQNQGADTEEAGTVARQNGEPSCLPILQQWRLAALYPLP